MKSLTALSIATAILCGVWVFLSGTLGILGWVGFAGCTSFFAAGGKKEGFKASVVTNVTGVLWAVVIIKVSAFLNFPQAAAVMTAIVTFAMCMQGHNKYLSYIPGTFFGCFSTFAANGNWQAVLPVILLGGVLGYCCEWTGTELYKFISKNKSDNEFKTEV